jgi:hypothetical protein
VVAVTLHVLVSGGGTAVVQERRQLAGLSDEKTGQDATRARQAEAAAVIRAEHAQALAADESARIRADRQHALDRLTTATHARITALEETRDALRICAERAET